MWNPISCVLWPLRSFVCKSVVLWFNFSHPSFFFLASLYITSTQLLNLPWWGFFPNFSVYYVSKTCPILYRGKSESSEHNFFLEAYSERSKDYFWQFWRSVWSLFTWFTKDIIYTLRVEGSCYISLVSVYGLHLTTWIMHIIALGLHS